MGFHFKILKSELSSIGITVLINEPMVKHTSFKIGGAADLFCIANTSEELIAISEICRDNNISLFVLGKGSNILVSDSGIRGVTVKNNTCSFTVNDDLVLIDSGMSMPQIANEMVKYGLTGCEFLCTIPGTIGGGVRQNVRFRSPKDFAYYDGLSETGNRDLYLADIINKIQVLSVNGNLIELKKIECEFKYEGLSHSSPEKNPLIIKVQLKLRHDYSQNIRKKMREISKWRKHRKASFSEKKCDQPVDSFTNTTPSQPEGATAGCVFFNVPNKLNHPTGRLIDLCGLKGKRIGDALISPQHANYIVNAGKAKAADVRELMEICKKEVYKNFGIELREEIRFIG